VIQKAIWGDVKGAYPPCDLALRRFLDANEHGFFGRGSRLRLTLLSWGLGVGVQGPGFRVQG